MATVNSHNALRSFVIGILVVQLTGCGTLLYPERRNQTPGRLDAGIVILDAIGLLFFLIPGLIAFAVDFSTGCIYLPARTLGEAPKTITFDPREESLSDIEAMIERETGHPVSLTNGRTQVARIRSLKELEEHFAAAQSINTGRLALKID